MAASSENFIPRADGNFSAYAARYYDAVKLWWDAHGLDPAELNPLKDALLAWEAVFPAHIAARAAAIGARAMKDAARRELEARMRPVARFVQNFPATTDAERGEIGLTIRDAINTPAARPTTRPVASVDTSQRFTHVIRFADEATPTRRARPRGVHGAEVWSAILEAGDQAEPSPEMMRFRALSTRITHKETYPAEAGGRTAVYALRWVSPTGERGPWSAATRATVTG